MWFKNIYIYRFTKPFELSDEALGEHLAALAFKPCGSQEVVSTGWVPPLGKQYSEYVHVAGGYIMVCCRRQEKVLPAAVVNEAVEEKVQSIEDAELRKLGRKERDQIKDEIIFTLMPRAFTRSSRQYAYIDTGAGLLVVNSASAKRAEDMLDSLREAIGSLPVIPVRSRGVPQQLMTDWLLQGRAPEGFEFGHECELRDPGEQGGIVRCKHQDLRSDEINNHLQAGMTVSKLGLHWQGGVECIIDEQLAIKRLGFDDGIQEQADQVQAEDAAAQFDVDFTIMTLALSRFIEALFLAFGGEDLPEVVTEPAVVVEA